MYFTTRHNLDRPYSRCSIASHSCQLLDWTVRFPRDTSPPNSDDLLWLFKYLLISDIDLKRHLRHNHLSGEPAVRFAFLLDEFHVPLSRLTLILKWVLGFTPHNPSFWVNLSKGPQALFLGPSKT